MWTWWVSRSSSAPVSRSDPNTAGPLVEWQIAGDNGGAALVALAEDLEQQLGAGRRQGYIAELSMISKLGNQPAGAAGVAGASRSLALDQLMDQSGGRDEADR